MNSQRGDDAHDMTEDLSDPARPKVVFTPKGNHTATVIFFHGLGDSARGWTSGIEQFARHLPHVKFILPTAPTIPVTLNGGMPCTAWFDIALRGTTPQDMLQLFLKKPPMIDSSFQYVMRIIDDEVQAGIPISRLIFGGFSLGGFLAAYMALQLEHTCAGALMLSAMLFGPSHIQVTPEGKKTPFLYLHGESDGKVPLFAANMSKEKLEQMGVSVEFKTFPNLDHAVNEEELRLAIEWMKKQLPAAADVAALKELAASQGNIAQRRLKDNTSVFLRKLTREDLNGSKGVITSYDAASGRYAVQVDSATMALKADNLVQALKVTYKNAVAEIEDANVEDGTYILSGIGAVPADEVQVPNGSMLRAEGLQSAVGSKLNGSYGEVLSFDKESMRYVVSFGTADTKLKPGNLFP
eukprot:GEMP01040611.1.p1 GENE.GEMP01040611.1~~GEMP01040611.1.p1  ORF type:complete len:421 (+),score=82.41 GEMP01040611.1:34-1263(+)